MSTEGPQFGIFLVQWADRARCLSDGPETEAPSERRGMVDGWRLGRAINARHMGNR